MVHDPLLNVGLFLFPIPQGLNLHPRHISSEDVGVVVNEVLEDGFHCLDFAIEELLPVLRLPELHVISHVVVLNDVEHVTVEFLGALYAWLKDPPRVLVHRRGKLGKFIVYRSYGIK